MVDLPVGLRRKFNAIYGRVQNGEDFDEIAIEFSVTVSVVMVVSLAWGDHMAMELLRSNPGSGVNAEEFWASGYAPKDRSELLTGKWDAWIGQEGKCMTKDDPAEAIFAAAECVESK